ncbi:LysM peptidoglycan-binding domain-containing protein [Sediminivirga luteola]|uniref:LysM peptidoglycan-binding domain-containing protein n=1 Tax=Sediminivirga luteola TaxID=1774748 RepID=UPI001F575F0A|nr:LysM domain-containing protein [Sediminivirga luteola]MCI2265621.1 LysM peptidoglycan-binding domain-containing protein [Sediminivirga luteola]
MALPATLCLGGILAHGALLRLLQVPAARWGPGEVLLLMAVVTLIILLARLAAGTALLLGSVLLRRRRHPAWAGTRRMGLNLLPAALRRSAVLALAVSSTACAVPAATDPPVPGWSVTGTAPAPGWSATSDGDVPSPSPVPETREPGEKDTDAADDEDGQQDGRESDGGARDTGETRPGDGPSETTGNGDDPVVSPADACGDQVTVSEGDTLWQLAARCLGTDSGVRETHELVDRLVRVNRIEDRDLILPGQELRIPAGEHS